MTIDTYRQQVEEAVHYLGRQTDFRPEIIIQLGTGLGGLPERLEDSRCLPFSEIPHFPMVAVNSHVGNLFFGLLAGRKVAILQGRAHYYEGYSTREITFPLRTLSLLGGKTFIVANAAGGLNREFEAGSLMVIEDHINAIPDNPLRGANINGWGPRFPDMSAVYSKRLREIMFRAAEDGPVILKSGVYVAIPGPSLETPAETRLLRQWGADAVGMSTVPEVIVARHAGLEVLGISVLANINDPDNFQPILLHDVLAAMQQVEPHFQQMLFEAIKAM